MNLEQETKFMLKKYNITANKTYGQNFLISENAINTIIKSADISKEDLIIEIGPGLGTLTSKLLEKAGKVISIEIDKNMISILNERFFLYNNFELINDDILKININELIKKENYKKTKIVANLPYYITTPIITKLLEGNLNIDSITVMVQKEIAERLTDTPGGNNCGAITYFINYYTNPTLITDVEKECFIPIPKVTSSIIKLEILKKPKINVIDEKLFFKIIKSAFLQKRKTLINALSSEKIADKKDIEKMLISLNINTKIRGEKLSLEQFGKISDYISNTKQ